MAENFFIDTKEIKKISVKLDNLKGQVPQATASALNRTMDFTYTHIGREVSKAYSIKASKVKGTLKKHSASKTRLSAYVSSTGHTLSLANFPHSPKTPAPKKIVDSEENGKMISRARAKPRPVKVKIKKGGSSKTVNTSPKAFIAPTGGTGPDKVKYNVFRRTGSARLPITVVRTISVPQMIGEESTISRIQEMAGKKLEERIKHEIEFRINKAAGGNSK